MIRVGLFTIALSLAFVSSCGAAQQTGPPDLGLQLERCNSNNVYECATGLICSHDYGPPDSPIIRFEEYDDIAGADVTAVIEQSGQAREVHFRSAASDSTTELVVEKCD